RRSPRSTLFPYTTLFRSFEHLQKRFPDSTFSEDTLKIEHQIKGEIKIKLRKYYIEAICEGSRMLDLDLFQTLGKINDSFLAFNKDRKSTRLNSSHVKISY